MKHLLLLFTLLFTYSCSSQPSSQCLQRKLTFDIGSGSTKYYFAQVNICKKQVLSVVENSSFPFPFKQILISSPNNTFSAKTSIDFIAKLKTVIDKFKPDSIKAVATSAFRTADNGLQFAKQIEKQTSMNLKIITQKEEGFLGYHATKNILQSNKPILYWDIGGGSMQIIIESIDGPKLYEGKIGAVSFKDLVNKALIRKKNSSPNPIKTENIQKVINLSAKFSLNSIPDNFINSASKFKAIGIGGVHQYAILKNNKKNDNFYTLSELKKWLQIKSKLTDKQLGGKYSATDVTNMALVAGFMQTLNLEKIFVMSDINMAYALLYKW